MSADIKFLVAGVGGAIVGNWVAEKFLLKAGPDDPTGFIEVAEGFGMDDIARAACFVGVAFVLHKFL